MTGRRERLCLMTNVIFVVTAQSIKPALSSRINIDTRHSSSRPIPLIGCYLSGLSTLVFRFNLSLPPWWTLSRSLREHLSLSSRVSPLRVRQLPSLRGLTSLTLCQPPTVLICYKAREESLSTGAYRIRVITDQIEEGVSDRYDRCKKLSRHLSREMSSPMKITKVKPVSGERRYRVNQFKSDRLLLLTLGIEKVVRSDARRLFPSVYVE